MLITTLPMYLEALLMILIKANRLSQFLYLPEMEEVVEIAETRLPEPAYAIETEQQTLTNPLSTVDARVGRYLMDECICGMLKGETVILLTNQLRFFNRADKVIALENGRIPAQ
ncbi:hypothetical protein BLNAU_20485 [Blattamonas nauphoetae]|uniref:Uncharacterized protein n=1 Tax=Blattamonas nauphoetae TaxID=2049346 RepID=A0ABQ9WZ19_9EUKA|nr:hypothetical protein BLNAU_20485 [Blattamonas nauphoetae]